MKAFQRFLFTALAIALFAAPACAESAPAFAESAPAKTEGAAKPKTCISNKQCAKNEYCKASPKCPGVEHIGTCTTKPDVCTKEYLPVKGCNGKTYSNACEAAAHGQSDIIGPNPISK